MPISLQMRSSLSKTRLSVPKAMKSRGLLLLIVLLQALAGITFAQSQSPSQSARIVPIELELRLAHTEPAEGLVVAISETEETLFLGPIELWTKHVQSIGLVPDTFSRSAVVEVIFTPEGAQRMKALSSKHPGERLALLVGGRFIAAPTIRGELGDRVVVRGSETLAGLLGQGLKLD